jgi:DUF4097 and DUF4098 domain-containing protein YvlB
MRRSVGRITLAVTLITSGIAIFIDNLWPIGIWWYVAKLWPVVIILLGLEWIRANRGADPAEPKPRFDGPAIAVLIVLAIVGANASPGYFNPFVRFYDNAPFIPMAPAIPAIPGFSFGSVREEVVHTYDQELQPFRKVAVTGGSSAVTVESGEKFRAELRVSASANSREEALRQASAVHLSVDPGETVRVRIELPPMSNLFGLSLHLVVPKGVELNLENSSGSITVSDRDGLVVAQSSSGAINVRDLRQSAELRSTSGSVRASSLQGNLRAASTSGAIHIEGVGGDVKANATSGAINVTDAGGKVDAQASSGRIQVTSQVVGGAYALTTTSGGVNLSIPATAGVTVKAQASSGTVSGPSWLITSDGRHSGSGLLGDGAHPISIRTSSGGISVDVR